MFRGTIAIIKLSSGLRQKSLSPLLVATAQKHHAVASTEAKPDRISKNLSFRSAYDSPFEQNDRPMVLLYSWLVAKAKHIHKYSDFYMMKGYDVLHVQVNSAELLRPSQAQKVVGDVLDFTQRPLHNKQPIIVHGFSVGCYLYGEMLVKILANEAVRANMNGRVQGQILDSPIDFDGVPHGVSRAVTDVEVLQNLIRTLLSGYIALVANSTMKHYVKAQKTFEENPMNAPTLFLYSLVDKLGPAGPIEDVIKMMRAKGNRVYGKCWPDSRHVSHFHTYPIEYIDVLTFFLKEIGYLSDEMEGKIKMSAQNKQ